MNEQINDSAGPPLQSGTGTSGLPGALRSGLCRTHLPALDGLRAVSAFLVVFYHYGFKWCPGGLGVLAFFVISGFLITWLLLKEEERSGSISLKSFYMRRSLRIFPAFYVYWLLANAAGLLLHKPIVKAQALSSFFYLDNYYQALFGDPDTNLSHTWSLGVEEQFYLLWPMAFMLLRRNSLRVRFLIGVVVAVWAYRDLATFTFHRNQLYNYEAFDTRADHLLIGCLLAVLLRQGMLAGIWKRLCARAWALWVTLALLVVSAGFEYRFGPVYRDSLAFMIDPLLVALLIVQAISHPGIGFGAALNWPWMKYLGNISYSIYLYHGIAFGIVKVIRPLHALPWLMLPATVLSTVLLASMSYFIVEKPFLRMKGKLVPGQPAIRDTDNPARGSLTGLSVPSHLPSTSQ